MTQPCLNLLGLDTLTINGSGHKQDKNIDNTQSKQDTKELNLMITPPPPPHPHQFLFFLIQIYKTIKNSNSNICPNEPSGFRGRKPCFGIGHSLPLICQPTSEDIKHHYIIISNSNNDPLPHPPPPSTNKYRETKEKTRIITAVVGCPTYTSTLVSLNVEPLNVQVHHLFWWPTLGLEVRLEVLLQPLHLVVFVRVQVVVHLLHTWAYPATKPLSSVSMGYS